MSNVDFAEAGASAGRAGGDLDLGQLWRAVKRRRAWIILPTLAALGISFAAVNVITPRYTGETRILLENRATSFTRTDREVSERDGQIDAEAVQSQALLVTSRDLLRDAVRKLNLLGNPEFDPAAGPLGALERVTVLLGLMRDPATQVPEERVIDKVLDRLLVFPVGKSRVLQIEFSSQDPELAARGANTIADLYLRLQEGAKKDNARSAGAWLSATLDPLRQKVADAEARVEAFRGRNGLLVGTNNTTITQQALAELSTQLSTARSAQGEAQAKARLIREALRQGRSLEVTEVAGNEQVRRLSGDRSTLKAQIALESRTLLSGHPRIKELQAQLADVDRELRGAAEKAVRALENDARVAGARVDSLQAALDAQKTRAAQAGDDDVQLRALEREARTLRDQFESLNARYRDASVRDAQNATPPDARVVSRASLPITPTFPKKLPIVVVSTLATLLMALSLVVTRELLHGRAVGPGEAADPLPREDAPALLAVPMPAAEDEDARALRGLAARLMAGRTEGRAARLLVTRANGQANAGAAALVIARMLSDTSRAILVALDGEADGIAPGLAELLAGEASFTQVIHRDPTTRLHLLPAGRRDHARPDEDDALAMALDALGQTYDAIVLVAPAATPVPPASFAAAIDLTAVVATGAEDDPQTRVAVEALREAGAREIAVILAPAEEAASAASAPAVAA